MVGINPMVASHKLNVLLTAKIIKQKVRRFHPHRHQIIQMEVDNLLAAGFIREVNTPNGWPMWWWYQRRVVSGVYV